VKVSGIQLFENYSIVNYTQESNDIPTDIEGLLKCSFDFDTLPGSGITTASMVETISSLSV
jgi:hypothetical protein